MKAPTRLPLRGFIALFAGAIFAVDVSSGSDMGGGVAYVAVVMLALWLPERHAPLSLAVVCSVLIVLGQLLSPDEAPVCAQCNTVFQWIDAEDVSETPPIEEETSPRPRSARSRRRLAIVALFAFVILVASPTLIWPLLNTSFIGQVAFSVLCWMILSAAYLLMSRLG